MRVITFDQEEFENGCRELGALCIAGGYRPDCLVGIRNGGAYVSAQMAHCFPEAMRFDVSISRPTTRHKGSAFRMLVGTLSRPVQDFMRKVESRIRTWLHTERRPVRMARLDDDFLAYLSRHPEAKVLIVDDAIDSGITIARLLKSLTSQFPKLRITTAVITVTTLNPAVQPDYALYRNQTLIRFPWSSDAK